MTKLQKSLIFYGGTLLVVLTLALLAKGRPARYVPVNDDHPRPLAVEKCLDCHGPGQVAPRAPDHPPKDKCMLCHRDELKKK